MQTYSNKDTPMSEETKLFSLRDQTEQVFELDEAVKSAQSGIGHSAEQVFEWIDTWATGDKRPLPSPDVFPRR